MSDHDRRATSRRRVAAICASMPLLACSCSQETSGPPPMAGYSQEPVTYRQSPSEDPKATVISLPVLAPASAGETPHAFTMAAQGALAPVAVEGVVDMGPEHIGGLFVGVKQGPRGKSRSPDEMDLISVAFFPVVDGRANYRLDFRCPEHRGAYDYVVETQFAEAPANPGDPPTIKSTTFATGKITVK